MENYEGCRRRRSCHYGNTILQSAWWDSVMISGFLAEILTQRLPNASGERYRYAGLLGPAVHVYYLSIEAIGVELYDDLSQIDRDS
jgi:hypothetical protein